MKLLNDNKDGRHLRSIKTQKLIVDSTITLFLESNSAQWPTADQVAKHSNIGLRTVFRQFDDMDTLIRSCHERFMMMIEDYFRDQNVISKNIKDRITFVINERIKIYNKFQNIFLSSIENIQKFRSVRERLTADHLEGNIRLRQRFESLIPEVLELSSIDQAYMDASIAFQSWLRLSMFYKFSNEIIINKFISQTEVYLSIKK